MNKLQDSNLAFTWNLAFFFSLRLAFEKPEFFLLLMQLFEFIKNINRGDPPEAFVPWYKADNFYIILIQNP